MRIEKKEGYYNDFKSLYEFLRFINYQMHPQSNTLNFRELKYLVNTSKYFMKYNAPTVYRNFPRLLLPRGIISIINESMPGLNGLQLNKVNNEIERWCESIPNNYTADRNDLTGHLLIELYLQYFSRLLPENHYRINNKWVFFFDTKSVAQQERKHIEQTAKELGILLRKENTKLINLDIDPLEFFGFVWTKDIQPEQA